MIGEQSRRLLRALSLLGLAACVLFGLWAWRSGLLTSQEAMSRFVEASGLWGPALFVLLQIVQVVLPILPGGVSCLIGVLVFGPVSGFLYSYLGICIGSTAAFLIARHYGRPVLKCLFHLTRWFAAAIFFPVAPDDFLCYLAGTTRMSLKQFSAVIWLCKPFSIALYSVFLSFGWTQLVSWLHLGGM